MCSYLYAAFSLKRRGAAGIDDAQAHMIDQWRAAILAVAVDEMAHLVGVSNLTIALGGHPHLGRPNFPVASGYFPSGVVVRLTPFSPETLDHFIHLERPEGMDACDPASFTDDPDYERGEAYHGLMPSVHDYATVGALYDAIRANLRSAARRLGEDALFVGPVAGQIGSAVMGLEGVARITDLATAIAVIDSIVEQGEGAPGEREGSHYQRFVEIGRAYRAERERNATFAPAWPTAVNPVMRRPPDPEDKVFVDDPASARVLDFGNAVYAQLLRLLVQAFTIGEHDTMRQGKLLDAAIALMHVLARTGEALATMPASPDRQGVNAGLSFTSLRALPPLAEGRAETVILAERMVELAGASRVAERAQPLLSGIGERIERAASALADAEQRQAS